MKNGLGFYGVFLIVEIARDMGIINRALESDLTWEQACGLYEEFEESEFDNDTKGEYECIQDFLKTKVFDLDTELEKMYKELADTTIGGLVFKGVDFNGCVHLEFEDENVCNSIIWCTPFWEDRNAICFAVHDFGDMDISIDVPCKQPTNDIEFAEFKKFYIGQLTVVQGKFASVDKVVVDMGKKTYTVSGYLIPKQTIKFTEFGEWNSLADFNGNPIVDCQIDFDEEVRFQYVDYNIIMDAKEGLHLEINLDDTRNFGLSTYTNRNYRDCKVELTNEIEDCGVVQLIEVRNFKVNGINYEIHVDATNARNIIDIFCENGNKVSDEIYNLIDEAINKIDN